MIYHIKKARKESLDLERDICRSRDISFHVVPYKLKARLSQKEEARLSQREKKL